MCEKSKYGDLKTQTTVLNEAIRKAYEIPGNNLELTGELKDIVNNIYDYFPDIKKMYPGIYTQLYFKLNKLNVYTEGCHFKTHVDTPKDSMVGTLVLELPYEYTGGKFVLNGKRYNTKKKILAFFSDTPHSIKKIESGCRVSLTFYIMLDTKKTQNESIKTMINDYLSSTT